MNIAITKPKLGKDSKAFLAKKKHMLIDGKWVEARSVKTFEVEDPATQEIIAHVPAGDKADIDLAVNAARKAFETGPWSRISPGEFREGENHRSRSLRSRPNATPWRNTLGHPPTLMC
jgi:phenylacetaldehyde dehydrogenase